MSELVVGGGGAGRASDAKYRACHANHTGRADARPYVQPLGEHQVMRLSTIAKRCACRAIHNGGAAENHEHQGDARAYVRPPGEHQVRQRPTSQGDARAYIRPSGEHQVLRKCCASAAPATLFTPAQRRRAPWASELSELRKQKGELGLPCNASKYLSIIPESVQSEMQLRKKTQETSKMLNLRCNATARHKAELAMPLQTLDLDLQPLVADLETLVAALQTLSCFPSTLPQLHIKPCQLFLTTLNRSFFLSFFLSTFHSFNLSTL